MHITRGFSTTGFFFFKQFRQFSNLRTAVAWTRGHFLSIAFCLQPKVTKREQQQAQQPNSSAILSPDLLGSDLLSYKQFLCNKTQNMASTNPFSFLLVLTTSSEEKLHLAAVLHKEAPPFSVLKPDPPSFRWGSFILLSSEGVRSILTHPAHAAHYSVHFPPFSFSCSFSGKRCSSSPWPLCSTHSISLIILTASLWGFSNSFFILGDEWQERTAQHSKCGSSAALYSSIIMFGFVLYFLSNTSQHLICFLFAAQLTSAAMLHSSAARVSPAFIFE